MPRAKRKAEKEKGGKRDSKKEKKKNPEIPEWNKSEAVAKYTISVEAEVLRQAKAYVKNCKKCRGEYNAERARIPAAHFSVLRTYEEWPLS